MTTPSLTKKSQQCSRSAWRKGGAVMGSTLCTVQCNFIFRVVFLLHLFLPGLDVSFAWLVLSHSFSSFFLPNCLFSGSLFLICFYFGCFFPILGRRDAEMVENSAEGGHSLRACSIFAVFARRQKKIMRKVMER